uniref:STAS domain-containing protein n=1 Tax=Onchocerca volvulus TaxID=6282 RepID=A0A8R1TQA1_ONCVO
METKEKQITFSIERTVMNQVKFGTYFDLIINQEEFDFQYGYVKSRSNLGKLMKKKANDWTLRSFINGIKQAFPILFWLPNVSKSDLIKDIIAGITVGIICVPQAMAYAALANVNAVVGMYTSLFPALVYVIFGTSKHMNLGMFAVVALMTGNALERRMKDIFSNSTEMYNSQIIDTDLAIRLVATLTFTIGVVMAIFAILQLHFIAIYLADPVVGGFITGAASHVFTSQMPKLIGVQIPARSGPFGFLKLPYFLFDFAILLREANLCVVTISAVSIILLMLGKYILNPPIQRRIRIPVPFELFVMMAGTFVTYMLELNVKQKVAVVGFIPSKLPMPALPEFRHFHAFILDAVVIAIIIYSITTSVGKVFAKKHGYHINPSQELKALAICQLVGGFLSCHPASGSLLRAHLNSELGATSELSSVVTALVVLLVILLIGPLFYYLPSCVLASVIVVALQGIFRRATEIVQYWRTSKIDLLIWLVSFLATFLWNVSEGIGVAIAFAVLTVIVRTQWPKAVILGGMKDTELYKDSQRYSSALVSPTIVIYRYDAPLLFLNSNSFITKALNIVDDKLKMLSEKERLYLIIDASGFTYIDYTGIESLKNVAQELRTRNVEIFVAASKAAARKLFDKSNIYEVISSSHFFPSIHDAVLFADAKQKEQKSICREKQNTMNLASK